MSNEIRVHLEVGLVLNFVQLYHAYQKLRVSPRENIDIFQKAFGRHWLDSLRRLGILELQLTSALTLTNRLDNLRPAKLSGSSISVTSEDCTLMHCFLTLCEKLDIKFETKKVEQIKESVSINITSRHVEHKQIAVIPPNPLR